MKIINVDNNKITDGMTISFGKSMNLRIHLRIIFLILGFFVI